MISVSKYGALIALVLTSACVSDEWDGVCEVGEIREVFASPMTYHDKWFCGVGYMYERSELLGIYDRPIANERQRYEIALLLDARTARSPLPAIREGVNVRVFVRGRIDAADCNTTPEPVCVPVRRAIYLEEAETRILGD